MGVEEPPAASTAVRAFVQPAVVTITTTYTGVIYAGTDDAYLGDNWFTADLASAHVFTTEFDSVGFVVNSSGIIATAGYDVDPSAEGGELVNAAVTYVTDDWVPSKFPEGAGLTDAFKKDVKALSPEDLFDKYEWTLRGTDGSRKLDVTYEVSWSSPSGSADAGTAYEADLIDFTSDDGGDVGLLSVDRRGLIAAEVAKGGPKSGSTVVVADLDDGRITFQSSRLTAQEAYGGHDGFGLPQVRDGSSGAPLVCPDGPVCGHTVWNGEELNGVSSTAILALLREHGKANELGRASAAYRDGIRAYLAGDQAEAIGQLKAAAQINPGSGVIESYLAKAETMEAEMPLWEAIGWIIGVLAIPAAAIAGIVALLLRRRRRTLPAQPLTSAAGLPAPPAAPSPGLQWRIDPESPETRD
jgi:hypothetical protein